MVSTRFEVNSNPVIVFPLDNGALLHLRQCDGRLLLFSLSHTLAGMPRVGDIIVGEPLEEAPF